LLTRIGASTSLARFLKGARETNAMNKEKKWLRLDEAVLVVAQELGTDAAEARARLKEMLSPGEISGNGVRGWPGKRELIPEIDWEHRWLIFPGHYGDGQLGLTGDAEEPFPRRA
jgi:hypothetical protein